MDLSIAVDARVAMGKQNKRLRNEGVVPGVLYGKEAGSVPVQLDARAFDALYREAGRTGIVSVSVAGGAPTSAIIKSVQRNPLTGRALHVDFFAVNLLQEMQANVPLVFVGIAPAVEETGGTLFTSLDHIKVRALPTDVPREIQVDVSGLVDLDIAIHVADITLGPELTLLNEPDEMVAKVMPPRVEEEPEPVLVEGEELAEGEEAAEGEGEPEAEGEGAEGPEGESGRPSGRESRPEGQQQN
jgi:large subunit ribosomal protein L25